MSTRRLVWKFYERYNETLEAYGGMDYEDLLRKAVEIFETHEWVLDLYRVKYKYVCVDEAQDLNALQYNGLLMKAKHFLSQ